jgi:hypothetical protein
MEWLVFSLHLVGRAIAYGPKETSSASHSLSTFPRGEGTRCEISTIFRDLWALREFYQRVASPLEKLPEGLMRSLQCHMCLPCPQGGGGILRYFSDECHSAITIPFPLATSIRKSQSHIWSCPWADFLDVLQGSPSLKTDWEGRP